MKTRALIVVVLAVLAAGCVTARDRVAIVRGMLFAQQEGGELGQAVADELAQVAVDVGALDVDPATGAIVPKDVDPKTVEVSAPAARENAAGIAAERKTRRAVLTFLGEFGKELLSRAPWGSAAITLLLAGWALIRKRAVQGALNGMVNAGMDLRDKAKAGEPLGEAAIKAVFAFWSQASGAKADVESTLDAAKKSWTAQAKTAEGQPEDPAAKV